MIMTHAVALVIYLYLFFLMSYNILRKASGSILSMIRLMTNSGEFSNPSLAQP
jgi:hypothetical protein